MSNVDYSMEGPRELHHAMLECEMLRDSCIQVLEEMAKYLKTEKAPPEVEKSGKEEEVDSKVKELVKENSSKEEIIAKDNLGFVGAKVEERVQGEGADANDVQHRDEGVVRGTQRQLEPGSRKHHQADSNGDERQGPGGGEAEAEGANQMQWMFRPW